MKRTKRNHPAFLECLPYLDAIAATVDHERPQTLWCALWRYIAFCADTGMLLTNKGCYRAVACSKETIHAWSAGTRKQHDPQYKLFADLVRQICAAAREQYGLEGEVNPILTIWHQKFYDGFTDTPHEKNIPNPLGDLPDAEKLIKKYGGL